MGLSVFTWSGDPAWERLRLLEFLMREDVQQHYLKGQENETWLVRVDMNRLTVQKEAWAVS